MKFTSIAILGLTMFGGTALAANNSLQRQTSEACSWWNYDFDVRGFICASKLPAMTVYSAADVDRQIDRLEKLVGSLESRVKILEEK